MIIAPTEGDSFLIELFRNRFSTDSGNSYAELYELLDCYTLPFVLEKQMRRLEYPQTKGYPQGLPPIFYYFVPNTGWGSEIEFPDDPLSAGFVYSTDAIGLNFGCPLRLYFALKRLKTLSGVDEVVRRLESPKQHLAAIEELLWVDLWKSNLTVDRAVPQKAGKWFDWVLSGEGVMLNIECKYRPSDWPRFVDGESFRPLSLLNKAAAQLPLEKQNALNIVAITGYAIAQPNFLALIEAELENYRHVDAVVYSTLPGEISVHSLHHGVCEKLVSCFEPRRADYYQLMYHIFHHRGQLEARMVKRPIIQLSVPKALLSRNVPTLPSQRIILVGEDAEPYRSNILSRDPVTNEPRFQVIPSHIIART